MLCSYKKVAGPHLLSSPVVLWQGRGHLRDISPRAGPAPLKVALRPQHCTQGMPQHAQLGVR